jgi:predicted  nucleic acid-binding Zn-ribbon protein
VTAGDLAKPASLGDLLAVKNELSADLGTVKADIVTLKTDVTGLKTDVAGLKTDVGVLETEVSQLKHKVDAGFASFDARFTSFEERFTSFEERIIERMRDMQTELLRGYESVSAGQALRLRKLELEHRSLDSTSTDRLSVVEARLLQIEMKLGIAS